MSVRFLVFPVYSVNDVQVGICRGGMSSVLKLRRSVVSEATNDIFSRADTALGHTLGTSDATGLTTSPAAQVNVDD